MEQKDMMCPNCRQRVVASGNVLCPVCFDGYVDGLRTSLGEVGVVLSDVDMNDFAVSMLLDVLWNKL